jgi:soluble lytic murein transglycosylase-like protein
MRFLPKPLTDMRRILLLPLLSLALTQGAGAQEAAQAAPADEQTGHQISRVISQKFGVAREKAEQISAAVMSSASKYSLPPALLLAIISIESRFKERAKGANGATGLMQVVPAAHKQLVRNVDLTDPEANIETGSAILHGYLKSAQGDVDVALKNYGGSSAYAEKVSLRAKSFEPIAPSSDGK